MIGTIGLAAASLYLILGLFLFLPLFFARALYKSYQGWDVQGFIQDLPNWAAYACAATVVILFWAFIIYLCL